MPGVGCQNSTQTPGTRYPTPKQERHLCSSQQFGWIGVDVGTHTVKLAQSVRDGASVRLTSGGGDPATSFLDWRRQLGSGAASHFAS